MTNSRQLRDEYLQRVCSALGEYLDRGLPTHLHSVGDGDTLEVTFTLDYPDTFHALLEGRPLPPTPEAATEDACVSSAN